MQIQLVSALRLAVATVAALCIVGCATRVRVGPIVVNEQGRDAIRTHLRSTYASVGLKAAEDGRAGRISSDVMARIMTAAGAEKIEFPSIQARGKGQTVFVRAEIEVNGAAPPDGQRVRYLRMKHAIPSDHWSVLWDSNEVSFNSRK